MKAIVFDFGGVVFRWRPHELMRRSLPQRTHDPASTEALVAGFFEGYRGDWGRFDRGTIDEPELVDAIVQRLGLSAHEVHAVLDAVPTELQAQRATVDLLQRLHDKGHAIFYLSNMPLRYAEALERREAFFARFSDGIFSSRVKLTKPDPAIFDLATQRFGVAPAQTVLIDDVAANVAAARAQGWQAVQFIDAAQCEAELLRLI